MKSLALSVPVREMRRRRSVRCPDMVANNIGTRLQIDDSDVDEFLTQKSVFRLWTSTLLSALCYQLSNLLLEQVVKRDTFV